MDQPPGDPTAIIRDGHRTRIKWHRARRRADDAPFTPSRIVEGMRVGASVEVDLVIHADRGFAMLHDRVVDHATTGVGAVSALPAADLRALRLRDNAGAPLDEPVLLLEDLAALLDGIDIAPEALLQLDFKEDAAALDERALRIFADSVAPFARHLILSCGDAAAVRLLTDAAPGIRVGYDPCHHGAADAALHSGDFDGFVARAVAASPRAETVYLENRLILGAADRGYDLIAMFHGFGRTVDGYTLNHVDGHAVDMVRRLLALRVDQLTTDDPEGLVAAFG